jgi:hypothetical protein
MLLHRWRSIKLALLKSWSEVVGRDMKDIIVDVDEYVKEATEFVTQQYTHGARCWTDLFAREIYWDSLLLGAKLPYVWRHQCSGRVIA